jgi:hypothetical protein
MDYIGDPSFGEVNILADAARTASSIIEFGSVTSTQIFAQISPQFARITSVATDDGWIRRNRALLDAISCRDRPMFQDYQTWSSEVAQGT